MKTINVKDASGLVLNWLVATALGHSLRIITREEIIARDPEMDDEEKAFHRSKAPRVRDAETNSYLADYAEDRNQAGIICEKQKIGTAYDSFGLRWIAVEDGGYAISHGPTPAIAAMRCFVFSKLGEYVEVPEELV